MNFLENYRISNHCSPKVVTTGPIDKTSALDHVRSDAEQGTKFPEPKITSSFTPYAN